MMNVWHKNWWVLLAVGVVLVDSSSAAAQRGRGRGFNRFFGGVPRAQLAVLDQVQGELQMTDEQKTRTAEINDQLRDDRRSLWGRGFGEFSEIRAEAERLNREASEKVDEVLDDGQRKRLLEIFVQVNGPRSLNDPDVVEALELSEDQKTKLDEVREQNAKAFEDALAEYGRDWRQHAGDLGDKADERLLGVLTEPQRERLEAMKGAPLEIDFSQFRRGRGRD